MNTSLNYSTVIQAHAIAMITLQALIVIVIISILKEFKVLPSASSYLRVRYLFIPLLNC